LTQGHESFLGAPYMFLTVDTGGAVFFGMGARGRRAPCPLAPPLVQCAPGSRPRQSRIPGLGNRPGIAIPTWYTVRGIMNELSKTHPSGFIKYTRMDMTKFRELVEMVRSAVQKKDTNMEASCFSDKRTSCNYTLPSD
jgi:hypothetical protein